jgi:hypothetical protein
VAMFMSKLRRRVVISQRASGTSFDFSIRRSLVSRGTFGTTLVAAINLSAGSPRMSSRVLVLAISRVNGHTYPSSRWPLEDIRGRVSVCRIVCRLVLRRCHSRFTVRRCGIH